MHPISILIVEPSEIVTEGVKHFLSGDACFNVLAPLHDTQNLAARVMSSHPDILLLDPVLLAAPARPFLAQLQQQRPGMAMVALVCHYVEPSLLSAFCAVLDISVAGNRVAGLLAETVGNNNNEEVRSENFELSDREIEVLVLVAKGFSSKEIADKLNISVHTVNTHRKNITHKTGIRSVAGLAVFAMLHNLM